MPTPPTPKQRAYLGLSLTESLPAGTPPVVVQLAPTHVSGGPAPVTPGAAGPGGRFMVRKAVPGAVTALVAPPAALPGLRTNPRVARLFDFDRAEPTAGGVWVPRRGVAEVTVPRPPGGRAWAPREAAAGTATSGLELLEKWLRAQSSEVQDEWLGREAAEAFRSGRGLPPSIRPGEEREPGTAEAAQRNPPPPVTSRGGVGNDEEVVASLPAFDAPEGPEGALPPTAEAPDSDDHDDGQKWPWAEGQFRTWFNQVTWEEFMVAWRDRETKKAIEKQIRKPGKLHEWLMAARANKFKGWGITIEEIQTLRTRIAEVDGKGWIHGKKGSTTAHNEILKIIDSAATYEQFVEGLNVWAETRMTHGRAGLPPGLRIPKIP